jgi:murein L,D-transpeptidase YcbB/YkuD
MSRTRVPKPALQRMLAIALLALAACAAPPVVAPSPSPSAVAAPHGAWSPAALADLRAIAMAAPREGLPAPLRLVAALDAAMALPPGEPERASRTDGAADALAAHLASAFAQGGVAPSQADPEWRIPRSPPPDLAALRAAALGGAFSEALAALAPGDEEYAALRTALAAALAEAPGTADAGGRVREERIALLRASLERRRWLPRALPADRIEVRTPHFQLVRYEDGAVAARHAVIVGAPRTPTPSFAAAIEAVTLNPSWTPPASILHGELLPRFARDPGAAAREGYEALDAAGAAIADVDWRLRPFPYAVRQRPGPRNALGAIKFELPNPYAVYLHDTPTRALFAEPRRAFSHGCVRVAQPASLAAALLGGAWTAAALEQAAADGATRRLPLAETVPVYFLYLTAMRGADGAIVYADDLYGRDRALLAALDGGAEAIASAPRAESECAASPSPG